jgi:hypothetical protein
VAIVVKGAVGKKPERWMLEYLLTVDWGTTGRTALSALVGAGLGSALVQGAFSLMGERRRKNAHATYLAMRIAVLLDAFGLACSELINFNMTAEHPRNDELPNWDIHIPEMPPYPEDIEGWVSLDRALASRCLRLRGKIRASQSLIDGTREFAEHDLGETVDEQAAAMGLEAWRLAAGLHRKYRLDPVGGEYASFLEEKKTRIIKAQNNRREEAMLARKRRSTGKTSALAGDRA